MRFPRHCYSVTGTLCKHGLSVNDKVVIKKLYQFSGGLVQTFNQNFIVSSKTMFTQRSRDAITVTWKTRHFRHFTSEQNKVSKSEVVEKVIPAADF